MGWVTWIFTGVLAASNLLVLAWLLLGLRARDAARRRALARRCALALAAAVVATIGTTVTLAATTYLGMQSAGPADRASTLARGISETLNCAVFGAVLSIAPAVAWIVLVAASGGRQQPSPGAPT